MANRKAVVLDGTFQALAHPIRRGILDQLAKGPASVGAVSEAYDVAAPTISRHLLVLEDAGLLARTRVGREHRLALRPRPLLEATSWLVRDQRFWDERLDALEDLVASLDETDRKRRRG